MALTGARVPFLRVFGTKNEMHDESEESDEFRANRLVSSSRFETNMRVKDEIRLLSGSCDASPGWRQTVKLTSQNRIYGINRGRAMFVHKPRRGPGTGKPLRLPDVTF